MSAEHAQVVIVGAGPTGCTAALLLAKLGIRCVLLERRRAPTFHPSAHVINARTLEVWDQIAPDLAREIVALSPSLDETREVLWCTSLFGRELGSIDLVPPQDQLDALLKLSPYRTLHLGQHRIELLLWRWVRNEPLIDFRMAVNVDYVDVFDDRVEIGFGSSRDTRPGQARLSGAVNTSISGDGRSSENGLRGRISARYVLACDGAGSRIRQKLGIGMPGPTLAHVASVFFNADVPPLAPHRPLPVLSWIYNPDFAGVLINHMRGDFVLMTSYFPPVQSEMEFDPGYWKEAIPKALGRSDLLLRVKSCGTWSMTAQLADRFRDGRVLLLGDAAHRFPPTGGYGLNTGVQDAHNVAWKLAAVIEGRATDRLLDTYEIERRPVAQFNCEQSVRNHLKMDEVTGHFRVTGANLARLTRMVTRAPFRWMPSSWQRVLVRRMMAAALAQTAPLLADGPRSERLRKRVAEGIPLQIEHFGARGVELGFAYGEGLVRPEPTSKPVIGSGTIEYRPTTWPGARLPHVDVTHCDRPVSVHRLLDQRDFVVFCGPDAAVSWRSRIAERSAKSAPAVRVEVLDTPEWENVYEVGRDGAVLVRPDGHVVWRTLKPPSTAAAELMNILDRLWSGFR